jgi:hypothetical protein
MQKKRILVIYFSQSGQLKSILDSVTAPLIQAGHEVEYCFTEAIPAFPFPWTSDQFFGTFPETFMGIPCQMKPIEPKYGNNYDLILVGYSPWYLSPSIPAASFLQSPQAKTLLKDKPVITVIGCRNMWLMSQEKVKKYLQSAGGRLIGNIALRDKAGNLTSVLTIIRWLMKGRQGASGLLPRAGVSEEDISGATRFGDEIAAACEKERFEDIQMALNAQGAVLVKPNLLLFERNGSKIFKMWATKILKKGPYGDSRRGSNLKLFKAYLITVLFVVSPIGNAVFLIIKLFISKKVKRDIEYFSQNALAETN